MKSLLELIKSILNHGNINAILADSILNTIEDSYAVITWPEVQELMEEDWFDEEAILDNSGKFGSSAYFVPLKRIIK